MIITRHLPGGEPRFTGITVTLNGIPVDTPLCRVSAFPYNTPWPGRQRPLDQTEEAAFLGFEADEPVTLHIRWAHRRASRAGRKHRYRDTAGSGRVHR